VPGTVLVDAVMLLRLYLAAKPFHVGVDVHGLAYPLHCLMVYDRQTKGQGFLSGAALSHCDTEGDGGFTGGVNPPGLDI
jgi:hypothetical protein